MAHGYHEPVVAAAGHHTHGFYPQRQQHHAPPHRAQTAYVMRPEEHRPTYPHQPLAPAAMSSQEKERALEWLTQHWVGRKGVASIADEILPDHGRQHPVGHRVKIPGDRVVRYMTASHSVYKVAAARCMWYNMGELFVEVDDGEGAMTDVARGTISDGRFAAAEVPVELLLSVVRRVAAQNVQHRRRGDGTAADPATPHTYVHAKSELNPSDLDEARRIHYANNQPTWVTWRAGGAAFRIEARDECCLIFRDEARQVSFKRIDVVQKEGRKWLRIGDKSNFMLPETEATCERTLSQLKTLLDNMPRQPVRHNFNAPPQPQPQPQPRGTSPPLQRHSRPVKTPVSPIVRDQPRRRVSHFEEDGLYDRHDHPTVPLAIEDPPVPQAVRRQSPVPPVQAEKERTRKPVKGLKLQPIKEMPETERRTRMGAATPRLLADALSPRGGGTSPTFAPVAKVSEREVLEANLRRFGFVEHPVDADGNCQFRSIAYFLFNDVSRHKEVRRKVIEQLANDKDSYEAFVEEDYASFLETMGSPTQARWGDHITLQAAADHYAMLINVVTSHSFDESVAASQQRGGWLHQIRPKNRTKAEAQKREIWVCHFFVTVIGIIVEKKRSNFQKNPGRIKYHSFGLR